MKLSAVALVAAGAVAGFVLGGIAPRRELEDLRAERDALQAQLDDVDRPNLLEAFLPRLGEDRDDDAAARPAAPAQPGAAPSAPKPAAEPAPGERPPPQGDVAVIGSAEPAQGAAAPASRGPTGSEAEAAQVPANAPERGDDEPESDDARDDRPRGRRMLERFDQLVTAQRVRMAAARAALIEQAGLDEAQMKQVDSTVARVNGKLNGYGEEVIAQVASETPPAPAQALGLGHDVSGILYEGQKELDAVVGDAADKVDDSALQIWSYVDLQQWRPFVEKQLAARGKSLPAQGGGAGSGAE